MKTLRLAVLALALIAAGPSRSSLPVQTVLDGRLTVTESGATATAAYWSSSPLDTGVSQATQALIFIHGERRDASVYRSIAKRAQRAAGAVAADAILVTPQFLEVQDVSPDPGQPLVWKQGGWIAGDPAVAPAPISSFAVLDAIVARLADRSHFPEMRSIVIAGHSAGAQLIGRYAVVGHAADALHGSNIALHYVLANPSSYLYFDAQRPAPTAGCPTFNDWKYGFANPPPYVGTPDIPALEAAYVVRDVTYVVGSDDTDPDQAALDITCPAEAQGASRYVRAHDYVAYLQHRHPGFSPRIIDVSGVAHSASGIYLSHAVLPLLFGGPQ